MAKTKVILASDRSPATTVALTVLCALGLVQMATLGLSAWGHFRPATAENLVPETKEINTPVIQPAAQVPQPLSVPTGLPPLPAISLPSATLSGLPPLPTLPSGTLPPPVPRSLSTPPPARSLLGPASERQPTPPPAIIPKTGNAQVDDLIDVAVQSRELNDAQGAMQALERADLIMPDNPTILREKAITFGKLGQADKAKVLWDRISKLGPGAGAMPAGGVPARTDNGGGLNNAFASLTGGNGAATGPLTLGTCQLAKDTTVAHGQKVILKIPVRSTPGVAVGVDDWNLDVFFYDLVDAARVEPTKANPVVYSFDMPVDFSTGEEVVSAVYHMPEMSPQDIANNGHRELYGYVVKLYYQHRLMSTAAMPRDLLNNQGGPGAGTAPAGNPLLPPPRP